MKTLIKFWTEVDTDANGNPTATADGDPIVALVKLEFEGGQVESFAPPVDEHDEKGFAALEAAALNVIVSDNCQLGDDDEDWFEWFRSEIKIVPTASEVSSELGGGGLEISAELGTEGVELGDNSKTTSTEVRGTNKVRKKEKPTMKGMGPGCKHPTQVKGWALGRVLSVNKSHRGKGWGRCFYQVTCIEGGRYKLTAFKGNRTDLEVGIEWDNVSAMFRDLMGDKRIGGEGRRTQDEGRGGSQGHRMTIKRWFNLDRKVK